MQAENIAYLIAQLRSGPPRPVALWFIDRPAMFYHLLKKQGTQHEVTYAHDRHELAFYGLPLYRRNTSDAPEVTCYATPFYRKPGVWIEMSDGNHVRVEEI